MVYSADTRHGVEGATLMNIGDVVWHHDRACHFYLLRGPGKTVPTRRVSKRFLEEDLEVLP